MVFTRTGSHKTDLNREVKGDIIYLISWGTERGGLRAISGCPDLIVSSAPKSFLKNSKIGREDGSTGNGGHVSQVSPLG